MKVTVKSHEVIINEIDKVNENEYQITKCEFEFSEEYTDDLVKVALFTNSVGTYKQYIINNECDIPAEILENNESTILGVYAYKEESEELVLRYSPEPVKFYISKGSYKENAENSEPITPTDKEQIEQAIANLEVDKQDKLIAGDNITIEDNVISAVDTIYDDSEIRADINDLETNKADKSEIPDVSNFVTKSVDDLVNYYLKSDTYTKEEVNSLISTITGVRFELVNELPVTGESNVIYLVPSSNPETRNVKDEFIWINNAWEQIGSTSIDLSGYVTTAQLNTALANYTTTSQLNTLLSNKANISDIPTKLSDLTEDSTHRTVTDTEKEKLANLQNYEGTEYSWLYNNATKSASLELMREINTAKANKMIKEKSLSIMQTGDYFQHDATIKYHYDTSMLYAFYVNNKTDRGDSAYSTNAYVRLSRLGGGSSGNISYKESYDVAKNGDTIDGLTIISGCGVPNAVLNGDTLYLYWSCKLSDNEWYECYNTFDCINRTLGTPHRLNLDSSYFSCKNLATNVELDFNEQISMNASIGDLNNTYYACVCSNNLLKNGVIIKSTDLINWEFVKEPSFIDINSNAIYEGAMAGFKDNLYLALRQKSEDENNDTVPMILAKLDTEGNVLQNVLLPSVSSRPCFFKRGTTELYLAYPTEKRHNTICLKIAENIIDSIPYQDIAISGNYVYIEPRTQNLQFIIYTAGTTGLVVSSMNGMQKTVDNIMDEYASIPTNLSDLADDSTHRTVTDTEKSTWNGKYNKPSGGIPDTDLSSAIQTSLGKADTALQSETYTGTITSVKMNGTTIASSGEADLGTVITQHQDISGKQDVLVSGENIKTINNTSILGSGNINISGGSSDANVYYLGKTSLYNTEVNALDLNELPVGKYYFKHSNTNNTLWIKATYKGNQTEPVTRTKEITLFSDFSSTDPKKPLVVQNVIILYIDKEFDENTTTLSNMGSLTYTIKDTVDGYINNYRMITLSNSVISIGGYNKENFNLQDKLVSGTNIKTINNESILGSGNISISGGGSLDQLPVYTKTASSFGSSNNPIVLESADIGLYYLDAGGAGIELYFKATSTSGNVGSINLVENKLYIVKQYSEDLPNYTHLAYYFVLGNRQNLLYAIKVNHNNANKIVAEQVMEYQSQYWINGSSASFYSGAYFGNYAPTCAVAPTTDNHLTRKSYVDTQVGTRLSTSNVKTTKSTTSGEVYDVTYFNSKVKNDFELLHNATLTEELAINSFYEITFNDCEEILLFIAFPDTLSTKTTLAYSCDGGTTRRIVMNNQSLEGLEIYSQINAENGFVYSMSGRRNAAPFKFVYLENEGSYINYFRILNTSTSANAFPVGTVIKLFGRRKR